MGSAILEKTTKKEKEERIWTVLTDSKVGFCGTYIVAYLKPEVFFRSRCNFLIIFSMTNKPKNFSNLL